MCGIVGYISKSENAFKKDREKFFIEALVMDTLRGWDSTGLIWLEEEFKTGMMRSTQPGTQFVRNKKFIETDWNGWAAIGHNRAATHGSVKVSNAHPFRFGDVALVHNGTLSNWRTGLPHTNDKIEVDSAMIAYNLSKVAPEEADELISKISGTFALVWTDARDQSINMVKNGGRPLHLAETRSKQMMYFMSEAGMLRSISERQKNAGSRVDSIIALENYKHLKFKKGSLVPEVTTVRPFVAPSANNSGARSNAYPYSREQSYPRRNTVYEERWNDAVKRGGSQTGGTEDNVSLLTSDTRAWRNGQHMQLHPIQIAELWDLYRLQPHMRMSFIPTDFIPWGKNGHGMIRGNVRHPGWGYTEWEATIYNFPEKWVNDERLEKEWTVTPIGLAPAWFGESDKTMPALMVQVRNFKWAGPRDSDEEEAFELRKDYDDEEPPFDLEDEKQTKLSAPEEWLGKELWWGPDDKLIWREQLEGLLEYGCCSCQGNLTAEDHEDIMWVGMNGDQPLCYDCQDEFTDPNHKVEDYEVIH